MGKAHHFRVQKSFTSNDVFVDFIGGKAQGQFYVPIPTMRPHGAIMSNHEDVDLRMHTAAENTESLATCLVWHQVANWIKGNIYFSFCDESSYLR